MFHIKPNNNNKFLNYMELSKNSKLNEYMQYFPEDNQVFTEYYNKLTKKNDPINAPKFKMNAGVNWGSPIGDISTPPSPYLV